MAASAEASIGVGIDGLAELSVGATGSLRLGKAAITASAVISPTYPALAQMLANAPTLQLAGTTTTSTSTSTLGTMAAIAPMATVTTTATRTTTTTATSTTAANQNGAQVTISLTASTSGINGTLEVFAEAELFLVGTKRVSETIASYSSGSASVNLLGPVTYTWF
jgi:hypothetical protein